MNPPSQIAGHLNKVPIKIQTLSLLIGFGSDRQPEGQCLFWFHLTYTHLHQRTNLLTVSPLLRTYPLEILVQFCSDTSDVGDVFYFSKSNEI